MLASIETMSRSLTALRVCKVRLVYSRTLEMHDQGYFGGSSGSHVTISRDPQQLDPHKRMERGERTTANRSAATPAWKPQRICKGKIDAMQAKSITGGQVRDDGNTYLRSVVSLTLFFLRHWTR